MNNKVYGLCRVSSVGQSDNTSINHQKDTIKKYCDLYGLELTEIVQEIYTGTTENRDGLNYLMDKVKSNECDTIIVYKIDRLMRSFRSGINFITDLIDNGCKIISTQEQIDTSSISGKFFMNILLSMSEMEKNTITQRLQNGKKHRFLNEGKMICSNPPFGYKRQNGTIVIVESESKIVKYIFQLWNRFSDKPIHLRIRRINKILNDQQYRFGKGVSFKSHHIRRIIKNKFYKGELSIGDMGVNRHCYGNVVSPRLFNLCQNW
jgi:site-specific DNA recombinase